MGEPLAILISGEGADRNTQVGKGNNKKPNAYVGYPAWSPLGNQIVYEYAETTGNIWLIELK